LRQSSTPGGDDSVNEYAVKSLGATMLMFSIWSWLYFAGMGDGYQAPFDNLSLLILMIFFATCALACFLACTLRGNIAWRLIVFGGILAGTTLTMWWGGNVQKHGAVSWPAILLGGIAISTAATVISSAFLYRPAPRPKGYSPTPESGPVTPGSRKSYLRWAALGLALLIAIRSRRQSNA